MIFFQLDHILHMQYDQMIQALLDGWTMGEVYVVRKNQIIFPLENGQVSAYSFSGNCFLNPKPNEEFHRKVKQVQHLADEDPDRFLLQVESDEEELCRFLLLLIRRVYELKPFADRHMTGVLLAKLNKRLAKRKIKVTLDYEEYIMPTFFYRDEVVSLEKVFVILQSNGMSSGSRRIVETDARTEKPKKRVKERLVEEQPKVVVAPIDIEEDIVVASLDTEEDALVVAVDSKQEKTEDLPETTEEEKAEDLQETTEKVELGYVQYVSGEEKVEKVEMPEGEEKAADVQEDPEGEKTEDMQEDSQVEKPEDMQEDPEIEKPEELQEDPEGEKTEELQEDSQVEKPEDMQEDSQVEKPEELQEDPEIEKPEKQQEVSGEIQTNSQEVQEISEEAQSELDCIPKNVRDLFEHTLGGAKPGSEVYHAVSFTMGEIMYFRDMLDCAGYFYQLCDIDRIENEEDFYERLGHCYLDDRMGQFSASLKLLYKAELNEDFREKNKEKLEKCRFSQKELAEYRARCIRVGRGKYERPYA